MLLDGDPVAIGDRVFHISGGLGTVETLEKSVARVRMDTGGVLNMYDNGYNGRSKQFYWYAPQFLLPRKGCEAQHRKAIEFAQTALDLLEMQHGGG